MMNRKEFQQYLQETIKDYLPESYADASINDVSQLQFMVDKIKGYGYKNIGFILDRGIRSVWKKVHTFVYASDTKEKAKELAKTLRTIDLLEMNGPLLREPYSKPLENGIFELRAKQGSDITRVLYFFIVGKKAVLTNGFIKKSQKTPKAEKELAKKYKADYERRYGNE